MAINSIGYAGTVTDAEWARLIPLAGGSEYAVPDPDDFRATVASGDRNVDISPGIAAGNGIVDESDTTVTINLPSVGSGSRWDMIGLHRDWGTGVTTVTRVGGSASKAIPARTHNPGVEDVQPLWLCRVAAGQTQVQEFVDLRCFAGIGGVYAADDLVRSYVDRVGTRIVVGTTPWVRTIDSTGSAVWIKDLPPDPPAPVPRASGTLSISSPGGRSIAFPVGLFSSVPRVFAIPTTTQSGLVAVCYVTNRTTTSAFVRMYSLGGTAITGSFDWFATL